MSAHSRITEARIDPQSGELTVSGPITLDPGTQVVALAFTLVQGDVVAPGTAVVNGQARWTGKALPSGAFQQGDAQGWGIVMTVSVADGNPPAVETFSWLDPVAITE